MESGFQPAIPEDPNEACNRESRQSHTSVQGGHRELSAVLKLPDTLKQAEGQIEQGSRQNRVRELIMYFHFPITAEVCEKTKTLRLHSLDLPLLMEMKG